jgi:hypothetical protein
VDCAGARATATRQTSAPHQQPKGVKQSSGAILAPEVCRAMRRVRVALQGVSASIWTIFPFCWPSVHMLESTLGSELFSTSIWRVLIESGRR